MSYNKIKNISIKKDKVMITTAESNIHPIIYKTFEWEWASEMIKNGKREELIGSIIMDFMDGNFHSTNDKANRKFLYALTINKEKIEHLQELRWGWTKDGINIKYKITKEEKEEATKQQRKLFYENYLLAEKVDKEHKDEKYNIILTCGYLVKLTKYGFRYSYTKTSAAEYDFLTASALASGIPYHNKIDPEYKPKIIKIV